MVKNQSF